MTHMTVHFLHICVDSEPVIRNITSCNVSYIWKIFPCHVAMLFLWLGESSARFLTYLIQHCNNSHMLWALLRETFVLRTSTQVCGFDEGKWSGNVCRRASSFRSSSHQCNHTDKEADSTYATIPIKKPIPGFEAWGHQERNFWCRDELGCHAIIFPRFGLFLFVLSRNAVIN